MHDKTVGMVSLGCAKNQVNSEQMIYLLKEAGFAVSSDLDGLDAVIVNTCGFIESAKAEAIDTILEFCAMKSEGRLKKVIVTGCLAERYKSELLTEIPEIDALLGTASYQNIADALTLAFDGETPQLYGQSSELSDEVPRELSTPDGWAYLKIAEGCDNNCAYCVIPSIRG
ncbi:MAG: hypothetical protein LBN43_00030 [Oscillospiraceae bacterium]|jgi:ribosomal protein S12 methylthiotransferase|nr:hypothetical protein [Oscillospiraceae bacterium]